MSSGLKALLVGLTIVAGFAFVGATVVQGGLTHPQDALPSMTFLGGILGTVAAFVTYQLSGNRKTIAADATVKSAALNSPPPAGQARLYLFRDGVIGMAVGADFSVDGRSVAQLKGHQFTCVDVDPGSHTVAVKFGGLALGGSDGQSRKVELDAPDSTGWCPSRRRARGRHPSGPRFPYPVITLVAVSIHPRC